MPGSPGGLVVHMTPGPKHYAWFLRPCESVPGFLFGAPLGGACELVAFEHPEDAEIHLVADGQVVAWPPRWAWAPIKWRKTLCGTVRNGRRRSGEYHLRFEAYSAEQLATIVMALQTLLPSDAKE